MNWQDKGFLLSVNKYNENKSIANFYTKKYGKITGLIFGSTSKKIKSYLFLGNKLHLNFSSKNENSIGNFKVEIDKVYTPFYLDNKIKLQCIIYTMQIIDTITVENQVIDTLFENIESFFKIINDKEWLSKFILWELNLFKIVGYEINFKDYSYKKNVDGVQKFYSKNENKEIPNFLIDKKITKISKNDLINAQDLITDFLNKTVLNDERINIPFSRQKFINLVLSI